MTVSFELDGDTVLFSAKRGELLLLNPTAAQIWHDLRHRRTMAQIAGDLARATGIPIDVALSDCEAIIAQWREMGLLDPGVDDATTPSPIPARWWVRDEALPRGIAFQPEVSRRYQIGDFSFCLRTADRESDRAAHEYLAHLARPADEPASTTIDLYRNGDGWLLSENQRVIDRCRAPNGLVPLVHRNLMLAAYRGSQCMAAIHAAALARDGRCLLLAGVAGSGKTTLTAALLAHGLGYCTDDLVLLTPAPVRVRGVPLRLGLKEGSWAVVTRLWPELEKCPTYLRADGQLIRYFRPANSAPVDEPDTSYPATTLVFPRYREDGGTELRELRRGEALVMLTRAGYDFSEVINEHIVRDLVDWMSRLSCYQLEYSDLDEAVHEIQRIFPARSAP